MTGSESWAEILTPPSLGLEGELGFRARVWTTACIVAAAASGTFAGARLAMGNPGRAFVDGLGALAFIYIATRIQKTGLLRYWVRVSCAVALFLLFAALLFGDGLSLTGVAGFGLIPMLASFGLARREALLWAAVVAPFPLLPALFWGTGQADGAPSVGIALGVLFAGLGASSWTYETLAEHTRSQRDAALAALREERLASQDLVVSRNQFVRNVSHEFRTPLNHIIGAAQLLEATSLDTEQVELVSLARKSGTDLLGIIDGALDVHDLEQGHVQLDRVPINFEVLLARISRRFSTRARTKGLRFAVELDPDFPSELHGDLRRIEQVLDHLLDNALAFTPTGSVVLRASYGGGGRVKLMIEDTGVGIAAGNLEGIFQAFRQVDDSDRREKGGLGTGLALCRHLARYMGGDITVRSTPGQGSTFCFEAKLSDRGSSSAGAEGDPATRMRNARILLAEPNPRTRKGFMGTLERLGLRATGVASQEELVERTRGEAYDIVLVDADLPGPQSLEELGATLVASGAFLVALTRSQSTADIVAVPMGFDDQLPKPLRKEQVLDTIRRWADAG